MGLGVIINNEFKKNSLPIYGNLNFQRNLVFAYRPNGLMGMDLSDNNVEISEARWANTPNGYTGTSKTKAETKFKSNSDDITIVIVAKSSFPDGVSGTYGRSWLASSYSIRPQSGLGVLIEAKENDGKKSALLRSYLTYKDETGVFRPLSLPGILIDIDEKDSTENLYIVFRVNSKSGYCDHSILNKSLHTSIKTTEERDISLLGRNGKDEGCWNIAGSNGDYTGYAVACVKQVLIYDRYLSDTEIQEQYIDDQTWLLGEHEMQF